MKILYVHQYYKTPAEGGANRSYYMSQALRKAGHDVHILTSHNEKNTLTKNIDGVYVTYLPVFYNSKFGFYKRIMAFFRFIVLAKRWLKAHHNFDKSIVSSTPLTIGFIGEHLKTKYAIPYLFEVRDLWPEAPIQMGVLKNPMLKWYWRKKELSFYQQAEKIIALSPGMRNHIEKMAPNATVTLIPNVADCDFFNYQAQKNTDLELHYGVTNKFVVSYFGAIGPVNDLNSLIDCASFCTDLPIRFLIMGDGPFLGRIKEKVKKLELRNVFFIPYGNKNEVKRVMNITDACYVSFLHKPVLRTNSPNKFFDAIASGKLIITNIQGWIRALVEKRHIGFFADSDVPGEFREKIEPFINNKSLLNRYQISARETAEQFFNREDLAKKFVSCVENKHYSAKREPSIFSLTA